MKLFNAETPEAGAELRWPYRRHFEGPCYHRPGYPLWGRVLSRLGDIYGSTVNLAARLTALADPGTVLVDQLTASVL